MTACIYGLVDPRDNKVFYVGQTIQSIYKRLRNHISHAKRQQNTKNYRCNKINTILNLGLKVKTIILEWIYDLTILDKREKHWIAIYKTLVKKLSNISAGGNDQKHVEGEKSSNHKLTNEKVFLIIELYKYTNMSCDQISKLSYVKMGTIHSVICGKTWRHITGGKVISLFNKNKTGNGYNAHNVYLTREHVENILCLYKYTNITTRQLANIYGVRRQVISDVVCGISWKNINGGIKTKSIFKKSKFSEKSNKKLNNNIVKTIIELYKYTNLSANDISKLYKISSVNIEKIIRGDIWTSVNFGVKTISLFDKKKDLKGEKHPNSKLTENDVIQIKEYLKKDLNHREISKITGINKNTIGAISSNRLWSHVTI